MAAVLFKFLNWDRLLGALIGFMLSWAIIAGLNEFIWYPQAKEEGRQEERAAQLARTWEIIQQRSRTDAEINALDDAGLCAALGGRWVPDKKLCE